MRIVHVFVASLFMASGVLAGSPPTGLVGSGGWIREAPPNAPVRAGYVELLNAGDAELVVTGARSEAFGAIEIHEMAGEGDMMRMRRLRDLTMAAGETVSLEPGGKHLMLFRPTRPLAAGDVVEVVLELAEGDSVTVELQQR